jgi:hypothetical protein
MAVDVADEKPNRPEAGQRAVVRGEARRRRFVLNRRSVSAAVGAPGALEMRRRVDAEAEARQASPGGERPARLRPAE